MSVKTLEKRMSGILLHPTSLPSKYGIGDFGEEAYFFVDFLAAASQHLWQILPLGPTGFGDSPYQSFSAFAGQPLLISPDKLFELDLLDAEDLENLPSFLTYSVEYAKVIDFKCNLFKKAFENFEARAISSLREEYDEFVENNLYWLEDYALYMSIKDYFKNAPWLNWSESYRFLKNKDKEKWLKNHRHEVYRHFFIQFMFYKQWTELKKYANSKDVLIINDIPIFTALDSADTWTHKNLFELDEKGYPINVAGVPPDYFTSTGQLWGNPIYDWEKMKHDNYAWWVKRVKHQLEIADFLRIDHFRGFEAYWSVPFGETTALNGRWIKGPGYDFFKALESALGNNLPIIAEDLGVITKEVEELRDFFNFPGIKVLQFGFDDPRADNKLLPHHYVKNSVCYTGTHDNDTTLGWFITSSPDSKYKLQTYLNTDAYNIAWDFIRAALGSVSMFTIIPLQDVLALGNEGRMNFPGTAEGNWKWRFTNDQIDDSIINRLKFHTTLYGR